MLLIRPGAAHRSNSGLTIGAGYDIRVMLNSFDHRRYLIPFRSLLLPHIFTDTLVIGSGVAGMRAAIEAAQFGDVIVLHKDRIDLSSTAWAQGGLAAVVDPSDSVTAHEQDTLVTGAGLCDPQVVRTLCFEGPKRIEELLQWGIEFDRDADGALNLGREGGHHHRRILHSGGAATGAELMRCLVDRLRKQEHIRLFDHCFALDLLTIGDGDSARGGPRHAPRVIGAITHHQRYGLQIIWAKSTILASGGAGQVYRETTNPHVCTGDGLAMAYRAGAVVQDLEFMQFHPTTLYVAGSGRSLISEAVRGEGVHLVDRQGRRFMIEYHDMAELAPRDVVSRAIMNELARSQQEAVYLDARHLPGSTFLSHFPNLTALLNSFDLDPAHDLIPVHPSAHYTIGGVKVDLDGRTTLPGLYACGEASCNGLHGANRLASNSLVEGLVFGRRAAIASQETHDHVNGQIQIVSDIHLDEHGELDINDVRSSLRSAMWRNVGVERSGGRLRDVTDMFSFWARYTLENIFDDPIGWETQNLLTVGALITRAAGWRTESRGVHYRTDAVNSDEQYRMHCGWQIGVGDPIVESVQPGDELERIAQ